MPASRRQPEPWGQACATPPPFAAAGCSVACSLAPRPGSALPCPGPTPPARSQQRSSTRPGPAAGARRPSARPRQRPEVTTGATGRTHPSIPEGLASSRMGKAHPQHLGPVVSTSHPGIVAQATRMCQAPGPPLPPTLSSSGMRNRDGHHHQDHGGEAVGQLSDGRAAAMSRSFGRKPYGRAAAGSAGPLPQVGGTRRYAAPMAAPAKTGPGPSSVPGILSPRKITVKGAPCGRVYDGGPRHP